MLQLSFSGTHRNIISTFLHCLWRVFCRVPACVPILFTSTLLTLNIPSPIFILKASEGVVLKRHTMGMSFKA
eukprot:1189635-Prorocentrum_minimum.AAC.8